MSRGNLAKVPWPAPACRPGQAGASQDGLNLRKVWPKKLELVVSEG